MLDIDEELCKLLERIDNMRHKAKWRFDKAADNLVYGTKAWVPLGLTNVVEVLAPMYAELDIFIKDIIKLRTELEDPVT